jgi:hypothetical protein
MLFLLSLLDLAWFQGRIKNKQIEKLHVIRFGFSLLRGILQGVLWEIPWGILWGNPMGDPPGGSSGSSLGDPPGETKFEEHQITINDNKYIN